MTQESRPRRPALMQAPVRALDPDGLAVVGSGTVAFAVGAVVCWVLRDPLIAAGRFWYFAVAVTGTGIGIAGVIFGITRGRRRRQAELGRGEPTDPAEPAAVETGTAAED